MKLVYFGVKVFNEPKVLRGLGLEQTSKRFLVTSVNRRHILRVAANTSIETG